MNTAPMQDSISKGGRSREDDFFDSVDDWVLSVIRNGGTDFDEIVNSLPSVYPGVVLDSLKRLASNGEIDSHMTELKSPTQSLQIGSRMHYGVSGLPVPHPLDFEWRFAPRAIQYLITCLLEVSNPGDKVVFLGTPGLFEAFCRAGTRGRVPILVDANASAVEYLCLPGSLSNGVEAKNNVVHADLLQSGIPVSLLNMPADVVVADPPWYREHICAFLQCAAVISRPGARILISVPPIGTRHTIEEEWTDILHQCNLGGALLEEYRPLVLPYETPPFERNALKAQGIFQFPPTWRRGDLALFRMQNSKTDAVMERMIPDNWCPVGPRPIWNEVSVDGVRWRVRAPETEKSQISIYNLGLVPIVPGDILPTVSRRDMRRSWADVWTSGNRVYRCGERHVLLALLQTAALKTSPIREVEILLSRTLTPEEENILSVTYKKLHEIIAQEKTEYLGSV